MYLGFKQYIKHLINMKDSPPMKYISVKVCLKCTSFEEKKKSPEHALIFTWNKTPNMGRIVF